MADFGELYGYDSNNGTVTVIPDTLAVRAKWETVFKNIFQDSDLAVDESSAIGRLIEAITMLSVDVLGINAQNANAINPNVSPGQCLDAIGRLFGHNRLAGESDASYRARLLQGQSGLQGFSQSVRSAISRVSGVTAMCVLENNKGENSVVPNNTYGITLPPHSIFVCVAGGADNAVADAIYRSKSAGCAYTKSNEYGTPTTVTIGDETSGSETNVTFYRPTQKTVDVSVTVDIANYTGTNIESSVRASIEKIIASRSMNSYITPTLVASAISSDGSGAYCTSASISSGGQASNLIPARPYEQLIVGNITITVL